MIDNENCRQAISGFDSFLYFTDLQLKGHNIKPFRSRTFWNTFHFIRICYLTFLLDGHSEDTIEKAALQESVMPS